MNTLKKYLTNHRETLQAWTPFAVYFGVALAIMAGLLGTGYILTFDMAWGPNYPLPAVYSNNFLLIFVVKAIGVIVPMWIVQKLILIAIITTAGLGGHKLVGLAKGSNFMQQTAYLGGVLYVFNPYFYARFVGGQWLLLIGYALLPWAICALWRLIHEPTKKRAAVTGLLAGAIGLASIHTIAIFGLVSVVMLCVVGAKSWRKWWLHWLASIGIWFMLNAVWLVPIAIGSSATPAKIDGFGSSQLTAFATKGSILGDVHISALLLHGFWADDQGRYIVPASQPLWWMAAVVMLGLIIIGAVVLYRSRSKLGLVLAISAGIGYLLALGVSSSMTAWLTQFIVNILPLYGGYREPQKWLMLLVIFYIYAAVAGLGWLLAKFDGYKWRVGVAAVVMFYALLFAPLLGNANGQIRSVNYPTDWYLMQDELNKLGASGPIVVLPWHMYVGIDFVGRTVVNPASYFFRQNMITGNNVELTGVDIVSRNPLDDKLNNIVIPMGPYIHNAGSHLSEVGVKYVMLMKQADWRDYDWLNNQTDIRLKYQNDSWVLYEVQNG